MLKKALLKLKVYTVGILILIIAIRGSSYVALAAGPYTPGETLDPTCLPTDTNCTVTILPTGDDGQIQFNSSGTFGSDPNFVWSSSTGLTLANSASSTIVGLNNTSSGVYASVFGSNISNSTDNSVEIGADNSNKLHIDDTGVNFVTSGSGGFCVNGVPVLSSNSFGYCSIVCGNGATASGYCDTACANGASAIGSVNVASGTGSSAIGSLNVASGYFSTASGFYNHATDQHTAAFGYENTACNYFAVAFGTGNTASSYCSAAFGENNLACGNFASAVGIHNRAFGGGAAASGNGNLASTAGSSAFGINNCALGCGATTFGVSNCAGDYAVAVGGGDNASGYSSTAFGASNRAQGAFSSAFGESNLTAGHASAFGISNTASTYYSSAFGYENTSSGECSSAFGLCNTSSGFQGLALGYLNTASGTSSLAIGYYNNASGFDSSASGYYSSASGDYSTASGVYNNASACFSSAFGSCLCNNVASSTMVGVGAGWIRVNSNKSIVFSNGACIDSTGVSHFPSDRNIKENFAPIDGQSILASINSLPISQWNYIANPGTSYIGPVAQDFYATFGGLGGSSTTIPDFEPGDIALVGIQALSAEQASTTAEIQNIQLQLSQLSATSSTSFATSNDSSTLLSSIDNWFEAAGATISNGVAYIQSLVVDTLSARKVTVQEGIEIKDQDTGTIYCVTMKDGVLTETAGSCDSTDVSSSTSDSTSTIDIEDASSTQDVSTSTDDTSSDSLAVPSIVPPTPSDSAASSTASSTNS